MRKDVPAILFLVMLTAAFAAGLTHLLKLRLDAGDVYSPYSSLRADPLGAKVLHDSLAELESVEVGRNLMPLQYLKVDEETVVLYLGADFMDLVIPSAEDQKLLREQLLAGARVVVALLPTNSEHLAYLVDDDSSSASASTSGQNAPLSKEGMEESQRKAERERRRRLAMIDLESSSVVLRGLDVEMTYRALPESREKGVLTRLAVPAASDLQTSIPWHSALGFRNLDEPWRPVLVRDGVPVVIERSFGKGSLVLMTDSYPFSNEMAFRNPDGRFVAWVVGNRSKVLFDETHLGLGEQPGVASLARRFRLHGLAGGILVLVALFVWRAGSSLVPRRDEDGPDLNMSSGRDAATGLVHLLRRTIPGPDLLEACYEEWKRSRAGRTLTPGEVKRLERVEEIVEDERARNPRTRNPVEAYRQISRILNERK